MVQSNRVLYCRWDGPYHNWADFERRARGKDFMRCATPNPADSATVFFSYYSTWKAAFSCIYGCFVAITKNNCEATRMHPDFFYPYELYI